MRNLLRIIILFALLVSAQSCMTLTYLAFAGVRDVIETSQHKKEIQERIEVNTPEALKKGNLTSVELYTGYNAFSDSFQSVAQPAKSDINSAASKTKVNKSSRKSSNSRNRYITLVTSGDGKTKEEATANALKSAIEQAYGAFVSSDLSIVNDEITRDATVSLSSGTIYEYEEISSNISSTGLYNVSVSAIVSVGDIIKMGQQKGAQVDFSGQTYAMNLRIMNLNRKNESEALYNMIKTLESFRGKLFDFEISYDSPKYKDGNGYDIPVSITVRTNDNYFQFLRIIKKTLQSLSLTKAEMKVYNDLNVPVYAMLPWYGYKIDEIFVAFLRNDTFFLEQIQRRIDEIIMNSERSFVVEAVGANQVWVPQYPDIIHRECSVSRTSFSESFEPTIRNTYLRDVKISNYVSNNSKIPFSSRAVYHEIHHNLQLDYVDLQNTQSVTVKGRDIFSGTSTLRENIDIFPSGASWGQTTNFEKIYKCDYFSYLKDGEWSSWKRQGYEISIDPYFGIIKVKGNGEDEKIFNVKDCGSWEKYDNGYEGFIVNTVNSNNEHCEFRFRVRSTDDYIQIYEAYDNYQNAYDKRR